MQIQIRRGEQSPQAKLTDAKVIEIRKAAAAGESRKSLAKRFGVSVDVIRKVVVREAWAHVKG